MFFSFSDPTDPDGDREDGDPDSEGQYGGLRKRHVLPPLSRERRVPPSFPPQLLLSEADFDALNCVQVEALYRTYGTVQADPQRVRPPLTAVIYSG